MNRNENAGHVRDAQVSCGLRMPTKIPNNITAGAWALRAMVGGNGAVIVALSIILNMFELGFVHVHDHPAGSLLSFLPPLAGEEQ
jgi:hypothetical protein